jgi:hypothetical protein
MPKAPEPYETRGVTAKMTPDQTVAFWRQRGYEQLSMFQPGSTTVSEIVTGKPPPAQRHSATSRAAAMLMEGSAGTMRSQIYTLLLGCLPGGFTDEEGQEMLSMSGNTYRPRRVELQEVGLVIDSKLTRPTRAKRQAVVWKAVPVEDL